MARLQVDRRIGRRRRQRGVEGLVLRVGLIPRSREADALPQPCVETHLVGGRALGFQVPDRIVGLVLPDAVRGVVFVGRDGQVTRERHTHRGDRTADLQVAQRLTQIPCGCRHPRQSDRRIEERRGGGVGQLRGPVVAARHREIEHLTPTHLHRGEQRLRLVVPARLLGPFLRVIQIEDVEDVRKSVLLDRAAVRQLIGFDVVDRGAYVRVQRPVVAEGLVDIDHHVTVGLRVVGPGLGVVAVLAAVGDGRIRRGVEFLRVERVHVVDPDAPRDVQPRQNVVRGREREHVALLVRVAEVAVGDPVGVLHPQVAALHVRRPELFHELRTLVVTFETAVEVEVLAPREEVGRDQRVRVDALVGHVLVLLVDVAGRGIQTQLVVQEVGGVAEGEVIAVVFVVGDDPVGIDCRSREIGLVAVRTARKRKGIRVDVPRLEEVIGRVAVARGCIQPFAPAVDVRSAALPVESRSVAVLELGLHERVQKLRIARKRHLQGPGFAFFRRDHDRAVRSLRTVEGGGCSARQHRHRLDVLGVQVGDGLGGSARVELRAASAAEVVHRNTVDDVQRVRRLRNGLVAAQHDLRGTAHARRRGVDRHAGHLARQRIDEVGILDGRQVLGFDLLYVVGHGLLGSLDSQGRDDDRFDLRSGFLKPYLEIGSVGHGHGNGRVADETDFERPVGGRSRDLKRECSVDIGTDTYGRALNQNAGPDNRAARRIQNLSGDGNRSRTIVLPGEYDV